MKTGRVLVLQAKTVTEQFQFGTRLSGDCSQNYHKNKCRVCHWGLGNLVFTHLCQLYYIKLNLVKLDLNEK